MHPQIAGQAPAPTPTQLAILHQLSEGPKTLALLTAIGAQESNISSQIAAARRHGWVESRRDEVDARRAHYSITDAGREVYDRHREALVHFRPTGARVPSHRTVILVDCSKPLAIAEVDRQFEKARQEAIVAVVAAACTRHRSGDTVNLEAAAADLKIPVADLVVWLDERQKAAA